MTNVKVSFKAIFTRDGYKRNEIAFIKVNR